MKIYKKHIFPFTLITIFALALTGCGISNTVANCIISHQQYTERGDLEKAKQPEQLAAGKDIYACVYVIESPKGMEYKAKWSIDGNEVKTDTQKTVTDRKGVIVFMLEAEKAAAGTLKFEISYDGDILASRELVIAEE